MQAAMWKSMKNFIWNMCQKWVYILYEAPIEKTNSEVTLNIKYASHFLALTTAGHNNVMLILSLSLCHCSIWQSACSSILHILVKNGLCMFLNDLQRHQICDLNKSNSATKHFDANVVIMLKMGSYPWIPIFVAFFKPTIKTDVVSFLPLWGSISSTLVLH